MEIGSVTYLVVTLTEAVHRTSVCARKRDGDDGRGPSWVAGEETVGRGGRGREGGGSGLARTPGGVDGVAQHRPEYYGLIKPS